MSNRVMRVQDILNSSTPFQEDHPKRDMSYSLEKSYQEGDYGHEIPDDSLLKTTPSISAFDKIEELQSNSLSIEDLIYKMMSETSRTTVAKEALIKLRQMTFEACSYLENYEERKQNHKRKYIKNKQQIERQVKQKYKHQVREAKRELDMALVCRQERSKGIPQDKSAIKSLSMKDKYKIIQSSEVQIEELKPSNGISIGANQSSINLDFDQTSPINNSGVSRNSVDWQGKLENVQSKLQELCRDTPPPGQITYSKILSGSEEKNNSNLDQAFIGSEMNSKLLASINKSHSLLSQDKTKLKILSARLSTGINHSSISLKGGPFTEEQLKDYFGPDYSKLSDTQKEKIVFNLIEMNKSIDDAHHVKLDDVLNSTKSIIKDFSLDPLSARLLPQHPKDSTFIALLSSRNNSSGYIPLSVRQQIRQYNLAQQFTKRSNQLEGSAPKESARSLNTHRVIGEGGKIAGNHDCFILREEIEEVWEKDSEEKKSHQISPVNPFRVADSSTPRAVMQAIGTSSSQSHFSYVTPSESDRRTIEVQNGQISGIEGGGSQGSRDDDDIMAVMNMLSTGKYQKQKVKSGVFAMEDLEVENVSNSNNKIIEYAQVCESPLLNQDEAILIDESAISSIRLDETNEQILKEDMCQEKEIFDNFLKDESDDDLMPFQVNSDISRPDSGVSEMKKSPNFQIPKLNLNKIKQPSPIKSFSPLESMEKKEESIDFMKDENDMTLNLDFNEDLMKKDFCKDFDILSSIESGKSFKSKGFNHEEHQVIPLEFSLDNVSPKEKDDIDDGLDELFQHRQRSEAKSQSNPRSSITGQNDSSNIMVLKQAKAKSGERKVIGKGKITFKKKLGSGLGNNKTCFEEENVNLTLGPCSGVNKEREVMDQTPPLGMEVSGGYNINENSLLNQRLRTAEFKGGAQSKSPPALTQFSGLDHYAKDINGSYVEEKSQDRSINQYSIRIKSRNSNKKCTKEHTLEDNNTSNISNKQDKVKRIKIHEGGFTSLVPNSQIAQNFINQEIPQSSSSQTPNSDILIRQYPQINSVGRASIASDQRVISPEVLMNNIANGSQPQSSKSVPKLQEKPAVFNRKNQYKKIKPLVSKQSLLSKMKEENDAQSGGATIDDSPNIVVQQPKAPTSENNSTSRNSQGRRHQFVKSLKGPKGMIQNISTPQHAKQILFSQQQQCLTQTLNGIQMLIPNATDILQQQMLPPLAQTQNTKGKSPRVGLSLKNVNISFNHQSFPISPQLLYPQMHPGENQTSQAINEINNRSELSPTISTEIGRKPKPNPLQQFGSLIQSPVSYGGPNTAAPNSSFSRQQFMSGINQDQSVHSQISPINKTGQENFLFSSIGSQNPAFHGQMVSESINLSNFYHPQSPHSQISGISGMSKFQDRSVANIQSKSIRQFLSNPPERNHTGLEEAQAVQAAQLKKTVMKRKQQLTQRKIKLVNDKKSVNQGGTQNNYSTIAGSRNKSVNQTIQGVVTTQPQEMIAEQSHINKSLNISSAGGGQAKKVFRMKRFFKQDS